MVSIFEGLEKPNVLQTNTRPTYHWVNFTGFNKSGKTSMLVNLSKKLRVVHLDLEHGTDTYEGEFLKCNSVDDVRKTYIFLRDNIDKIKPDIIAIDPLDALEGFIVKEYMKEKGIENLSEMPYGQGYFDVRMKIQQMIELFLELTPLLITVTHVKPSLLSEDRKNITYLDMDLLGRTKAYIQNRCDAHALFQRGIDEETGESYLKISFENTRTQELAFGGSRYKEFYSVHTGEQLEKEILRKFIEEKSEQGENDGN